jgi:preprotein translocase subunit SecF
MDLFRDSHIDFMKYRKYWIVVSLVLLTVGIFSVFVHGKLNVGIDFAGGTQLTLKFAEQPEIDRLRGVLAEAGVADAQLQRFGEEDRHEVLIKTPVVEGTQEGLRDPIVTALDRVYNPGMDAELDLNRDGVEDIAAAGRGRSRQRGAAAATTQPPWRTTGASPRRSSSCAARRG